MIFLRMLVISLATFLAISPRTLSAEEEVKIKILAVNPSESRKLSTMLVQNLPPEVRPDDITDKAGMEVKFDQEKKTYFLSQQIELEPKEARTFVVKVKNVWVVPTEELDEVKQQIDQNITALKGTKYYETAKLLYEKAGERLTRIEEEQAKVVGIKQRIELFRAHRKQLEDIQTDLFSLAAMRKLDEENKSGVRQAKFLVTAENPSEEPREMMVRTVLPKEIKSADDILEKLDFSLVYDENKKRFSLQKMDQFASRESKRYEIIVRDIWYYAQSELDFLKMQTENLTEHFVRSPYELYANQQGKIVLDLLSQIVSLQGEVENSSTLDDRIRAYVLNTQRLEMIKKKMRELQDLLPEIPLKKDKNSFLEELKYLVKKIVETKDLVLVAFGIQPNKPMTWWIVFGIIAVLISLSAVFYVTWLKKLQKNQFTKEPQR